MKHVFTAGSLVVFVALASMTASVAAQELAPEAEKDVQNQQPAAPQQPKSPKSTTPPAKTKDGKPGPATVAERDRILGDLYDRLATADNADYAKLVETAIQKMWSFSGSDTIDLLMTRASAALGMKNDGAAVSILNAVVGLKPEYAEGWNRRAFVHFSQKNYRAALRDLRRVLLLDPRQYKAIGGLAVILREYGRDEAALKAFRKALAINPRDEEISKAVKDLELEVEGRAI